MRVACVGDSRGGGDGGPQVFVICRNFSQLFAIFRSFPQLPCACPPRVRVGALCVPCAEVLLFEASAGYGTAIFLLFSPNFPAIFPQFTQFFAIAFDVP